MLLYISILHYVRGPQIGMGGETAGHTSTSAAEHSFHAAAVALLNSATRCWTAPWLPPFCFNSAAAFDLSVTKIVYAFALPTVGGLNAAFFRSASLTFSSLAALTAFCSSVNSFFGFGAGFLAAGFFAAVFLGSWFFCLAGDFGVVALVAERFAERLTGLEGSPTTFRGRPGVAYPRRLW